MKQSKATLISMLTSVISVVLSLVLLTGTTLAWFSVSLENEENVVQTGSVAAELWYKSDADGVYQQAIDETELLKTLNWQPGTQETLWLQVKNPQTAGALPITYTVSLCLEGNQSAAWANALQVQVGESGAATQLTEGENPLIAAQTVLSPGQISPECRLSIQMPGDVTLPTEGATVYFKINAQQANASAGE